ncbi:MAG: helix-turn-helix domain-containing protein [Clostridia bacterium]|nr:helix-turn-helix domain-containing protein [Clostridia bacterium]
MNRYVTGTMIRQMREKKNMTQEELAAKLYVSSKAVSKWETGQGLPDISLLEPLAKALDISMIELFSGETVMNRNRSSNMLRSVTYVCPVCGNSIFALGQCVVSCCGITLPPQQSEETDDAHRIHAQIDDGEYYVTVDHPMEKDHFITCLTAVSDHACQIVKQFPEGPAEARFCTARVRWIYAFCNRHGLFRISTKEVNK